MHHLPDDGFGRPLMRIALDLPVHLPGRQNASPKVAREGQKGAGQGDLTKESGGRIGRRNCIRQGMIARGGKTVIRGLRQSGLELGPPLPGSG